MRAWHYYTAVLFVTFLSTPAQSQNIILAETVQVGDCFRCAIETKVAGEMRFQKDSGPMPVKISAQASHSYPERVLAASGNLAQKCVRIYDAPKLDIERGGDRASSTLRSTRKMIVAQRPKDQHMAYSPSGALYRSELDLVSGHFDTMAVAGLLPGKPTKVDDTWKIPNLVAQALNGLEGMTENKLEGKLVKVDGDLATFSIQGTVAGVDSGALVKQTVDAAGTYDAKSKRLIRLVWKQKADRDQGPVSPASTMEVTVTLDRKAIDQPAELSDIATVTVPQGYEPPGPMTNLEYRDAKSSFALIHPRDWHLTAVNPEHTVLRLMDRGDYVAQVTVTPWTSAKKGEHLSADQFKNAMRNTSGWRPEKELQSGEVTAGDGNYIYRLSEQGLLDGVSVLQNFFLVAAPTGEQVVLTFTLAPKAADKLGARDLSIAASIEVPAAPEKK
ncbi:MAG: hypothetical protein ACKO23_00080 [Gemmataceae bacterium]